MRGQKATSKPSFQLNGAASMYHGLTMCLHKMLHVGVRKTKRGHWISLFKVRYHLCMWVPYQEQCLIHLLESIYWNPTGDCDNFRTCGDILAWLEVHLGIVQSTPATPQRRDAVQLEMEQDIREEAEQDSGEEPEAVSLTKLHETPTMAVEETAEHISKASVFLFICCSQLFNL
jgi:hypothetical protein